MSMYWFIKIKRSWWDEINSSMYVQTCLYKGSLIQIWVIKARQFHGSSKKGLACSKKTILFDSGSAPFHM